VHEEETLTLSLVVDVTSAAVCVDLQICDLQNQFSNKGTMLVMLGRRLISNAKVLK